jgi:hypothetical protein
MRMVLLAINDLTVRSTDDAITALNFSHIKIQVGPNTETRLALG